MLREVIYCYGYESVKVMYCLIFEFIKEDFLILRGDCIICIGVDKVINDFNDEFKNVFREGKKFLIRIKVGDFVDEVVVWGSFEFIFDYDVFMVVRKSIYIDVRMFVIRVNKVVRDVDRCIIEFLKNFGQRVIIEFIIEDNENF